MDIIGENCKIKLSFFTFVRLSLMVPQSARKVARAKTKSEFKII